MIWKTTLANIFSNIGISRTGDISREYRGKRKLTGLKEGLILTALFFAFSLSALAQNGNGNNAPGNNNVISGDDCIVFDSCPPDQTICADTEQDGVKGAMVSWTTPQISQTCTGNGSSGNFQMLFELNEELLSQDCWDFNYIQRVGTNGGYVKLFSSNDALGTKQSIITTPYLVLDNGSETSIDLTYDNGNYTVQLFLVDEAGNEYPSGGPEQVTSAKTTYGFTIQSPTGLAGVYRLKYVFTYSGGKPSNANTGDTIIAVDGILYDDGCSGGIDFVVTGPSQGFYPIGSYDLQYKATYTAPNGSIQTKTCTFNITVTGLEVQITNTQDSSCNSAADGSITAVGSGINGSGVEPYKYSIDGVNFQSSGTFTGLSTGTYNITVQDATGCTAVSDDVIIGAVDTEAPILTPPADDTLEGCNTSAITSLPYSETETEISIQQFENLGGTISDNGSITSLTYQDAESAGSPITVTRTFMANDACGNSASASQTISIDDNTAPVADAASLPTVTGQCSAEVTSVPTATDNCNGTINGTTSDPLSYSAQGTYTITWTFTDSEGNSSTQQQTVIVDDTTAPVADAASLPTVTGQCSAEVTSVPTATDNCNGTINGTTSDPLSYSAQGTYTITWTFTDSEGNSSTQQQTVIVDDTTAPVADAASLPTVNGQCSAEVTSVPTATDNCNGTINGTTSDPLSYSAQGTYTITWTFTDSEGNSTTQQQTVIVDDTTAPVADAASLPIVNGQCSAEVTNVPTATDNCNGTINGTTSDPLSYNAQGTYTITWTFTDSEGNFSTQDQTVIIDDTTAPVADAASLPTVSGQCSAEVTNVPTATDNCNGTINGTTSDPLSYNAQGTYTITWTFTDSEGNSSTQQQTVIVDDTTAPVADAASLPTVTGQCSAEVTSVPTATDNCNGTINGTTSDPLSYSAQGTYTITWTFTDSEGNSATQQQTVIVDDTTAPVADAASLPTVTGQCSAEVTSVPTATDNCNGTINGTTSDPLSYSAQGTYTITWTFTDSEGNSATQQQTVNIDDTTAPVADAASLPTVTGQCSAEVTTVPTATDNCNGTINGTTSDPLSYSAQGTYSITWTFTDSEGNSTTQQQTVIVDDTTAPEEITLADVVGQCSATVTTPATTDNCSGTITGTTNDPLYYDQQGEYKVEWTFDDGNGNTTVVVQNVIVDDTAAPSPVVVPDAIGECEVTVTAPTTTDGCSGDEITGTTNDPLTYTEQGNYQITWTFDDGNGNTTESVQNVIVDDTTAPESIEIADAVGQCEVSVSAPTTTDNCAGEITATTNDPLTYTEQGTYNVHWVFDDGNGNTTEVVQNVIVDDTTAPESIEIADAVGQCEVSVSAPTTTDNCAGELTGTTNDPLTYTEQGNYQITWTFDDGNGNTTESVQNVIVDDTTAPESIEIADAVGQCEASVSAPTTTDNCAGEITATTNDPLTYTEQGTYNVHWTFDDGNGNTTEIVQNVIVDDTTAPEEITLADVVGQCSATVTAPTTTDNCSGTITGTTNDPLYYDQQGEYKVEWTFDDGNGNTTVVVQNVIVDDTAAPSPVVVPDAIGECEVTVTAPTTTDGCSGDEITGTTNDPLTYTEQGNYQITWTFDDGNGNTTESVQNVIVDDTTAPENIEITDAVGQCEVSVSAPTTTDNCAGEITATTNDPLTYTEQGTYNVHWIFDDGNGNTTEVVQKVIVDDTTAPESIEIADAVGQCEVSVSAPTTTDNCAGELTGTTNDPLTYTEQGNYQITWTFDDGNGNTTESVQNVIVDDTTAPESIEIADAVGQCEASVTAPTTTDNCAGEITATTNDPMTYTEQGTHKVTWTFDDGNGNTTEVIQNVIVDDTTAPESIEIADAVGQCEVSLTAPTTTDNCAGEITATTNDPMTYTEQGTYNVHWIFDDGNGNTTEVVQNVIVDDTSAPELAQMSNISVNSDPDKCGAIVTYEMPVASDNCSVANVSLSEGMAPGSVFPVGTTTVSYTVTDAAGNTNSMSFDVTVTDNITPEIECVSNITTNVLYGAEGKVINFDVPSFSDNCPDASIEQTSGLASGSMFPIGVTTNTFVVTDASGNTSTCSFTVTVNENPKAPTVAITQPTCSTATGSFSVDTQQGITYSIDGINYQESGSFTNLPAGTYTVTAKDENGNISTATQVVINDQPETPAAPVIDELLEATCSEPTGSVMLSLVEGINFTLEDENGNSVADTDGDGIFDGLAPGSYSIYAESDGGCISDATSLTINAPASENIESATINLCIGDNPYNLFNLFPEGNDLTGVWTDTENTGALSENILDPALLEVGTYTFTFETTGECTATTTITAVINDDCVEVLPCNIEDIKSSISKVVTPNGDGHNDYFTIDVDCDFTYNLKIFNRWGSKIYDAENYQNDWDGFSTDSFTSSDQLPAGTYFYVLDIRNSGFEPIQGYIYLGTK